jgi:hypothetical protein
MPTAVEIIIDFMQNDFGHSFIATSNYRLVMGSLPDIFKSDYVNESFLANFFN